MDLKKIKLILDQEEIPTKAKEAYIIQVLAEDTEALPLMFKILHEERVAKNEMLNDLNIELGKAHIYVNDTKTTGQKRTLSRELVLEHIANFYKKYKGKLEHHFTRCAWGDENLKNIYD